MNTKTATLSAISLLLAVAAMAANAQPVLFEGHYYEVVVDQGITWNDADTAANNAVFLGATGHLATITSANEDNFIEGLRQAAALVSQEVWVGGFQVSCSPEPGCGWEWVNGEGAISTPSFPLASYSNWLVGEPNDAGTEMFLGIGLGGQFGWNDEQALGNIGGYVIEYDTEVIVDADECADPGGCNPTGGQDYELPPTADTEDLEILFSTVLIIDNEALCGIATREFMIPDPANPGQDLTLRIPKYLCGHLNSATGKREFVAIVVSTPVEITEGVILVENDPGAFFPNPLVCQDPIPTNPPPAVDIRDQDVVVWSTTDPSEMMRNFGDEFTGGCGSSRGRMRDSSIFPVGMQFFFRDGAGDELDWTANPESVEQAFIAVTRDKVIDLIQAVEDAKPALKNGDYKKMQQQAKNALKKHDRGDYAGAVHHVKKLRKFADKANFDTSLGFNHQGQIDMRTSNTIFTYEVKVIPYAP